MSPSLQFVRSLWCWFADGYPGLFLLLMQTEPGNLVFLSKYCQMFHIQQQKLSEVFLAQTSTTDHKRKHLHTHTRLLWERKKKIYRASVWTRYSLINQTLWKHFSWVHLVIFKKWCSHHIDSKFWPILKGVKLRGVYYIKAKLFLKCFSQNVKIIIVSVQINYSLNSKAFNSLNIISY